MPTDLQKLKACSYAYHTRNKVLGAKPACRSSTPRLRLEEQAGAMCQICFWHLAIVKTGLEYSCAVATISGSCSHRRKTLVVFRTPNNLSISASEHCTPPHRQEIDRCRMRHGRQYRRVCIRIRMHRHRSCAGGDCLRKGTVSTVRIFNRDGSMGCSERDARSRHCASCGRLGTCERGSNACGGFGACNETESHSSYDSSCRYETLESA